MRSNNIKREHKGGGDHMSIYYTEIQCGTCSREFLFTATSEVELKEEITLGLKAHDQQNCEPINRHGDIIADGR